VTLNPGAYSLSVSDSPGPVPTPGGSATARLCLSVGVAPTSVQAPVTLEGGGGSYHARAVSGTLLLDMVVVSGSSVSGTIRGSADDGTGAFSLSVPGSGPVGVSGVVASNGNGVSGTLMTGQFTLHGPQGYGGCATTNWILTPR